jgi:hypothetical protein
MFIIIAFPGLNIQFCPNSALNPFPDEKLYLGYGTIIIIYGFGLDEK